MAKYADGTFSWVDLTTTDVAGAKAFYGGLFGWTSEDRPTSEGRPPYTMFFLDGRMVAGGNPMSPQMRDMGAPPVWVAYVNHSDLDSVAARAAEAGGVVFMPPIDVVTGAGEAQGRMALIQDPTGAPFGVWQPGVHTGAEATETLGAMSWSELQTRDPAAAAAFYGRVFGWQAEGNEWYTGFKVDDQVVATAIPIGPDWGDVPSNWNVYFMVADVRDAAARAEALGGAVVRGPAPMGEFGEFAVLRDPQGAHFTVARWNPM
ncbi:VOC family protein [Promineifilum sp.]|uniref:VOC family protein n=1 Tax=Promineifilum sp. TaxID=2664178 RepID=UPI0035AF19CE